MVKEVVVLMVVVLVVMSCGFSGKWWVIRMQPLFLLLGPEMWFAAGLLVV